MRKTYLYRVCIIVRYHSTTTDKDTRILSPFFRSSSSQKLLGYLRHLPNILGSFFCSENGLEFGESCSDGVDLGWPLFVTLGLFWPQPLEEVAQEVVGWAAASQKATLKMEQKIWNSYRKLGGKWQARKWRVRVAIFCNFSYDSVTRDTNKNVRLIVLKHFLHEFCKVFLRPNFFLQKGMVPKWGKDIAIVPSRSSRIAIYNFATKKRKTSTMWHKQIRTWKTLTKNENGVFEGRNTLWTITNFQNSSFLYVVLSSTDREERKNLNFLDVKCLSRFWRFECTEGFFFNK